MSKKFYRIYNPDKPIKTYKKSARMIERRLEQIELSSRLLYFDVLEELKTKVKRYRHKEKIRKLKF